VSLLQKFGFLAPLPFSGRSLAMTVIAVDILGSAVDSRVVSTLDFVLLHLIILEPKYSSPQKAVEGLVKVKVVTSGSVYVARNITGVMLWMWLPEAGANYPVRQRRIPEER
jgi:uncharacterized membrane protein